MKLCTRYQSPKIQITASMSQITSMMLARHPAVSFESFLDIVTPKSRQQLHGLFLQVLALVHIVLRLFLAEPA